MIELNFYVKFNLILHVINYIHCCFFVLFFDRPIKCIELLKSHQIVTSLIPINGVVNKNCMLPNCCLLHLTFVKFNVETAVNWFSLNQGRHLSWHVARRSKLWLFLLLRCQVPIWLAANLVFSPGYDIASGQWNCFSLLCSVHQHIFTFIMTKVQQNRDVGN